MRLTSIALNNINRRKAKAFFLLIGMLIGTATVVALFSVTHAMEEDIANSFDSIGSNITMVPQSDNLGMTYNGISVPGAALEQKEFTEADLEKIKTIKNNENIRYVAPKLLGSERIGSRQVLLVGVNYDVEFKMKKWWQYEGRQPAKADEILLGSKAASRLGVRPGDSLPIAGQDYRVAGILKPLGSEEDGLVFMQLASAQQLLNKPGKVSFAEVSALCYTCPIDEIMRQIRDKIPLAKVTAIREAVEARKQTVERFTSFAIAVSIIVFAIGMLVVFITMVSSVNERTREIGILRVVGFRRSHIMTIIFTEAALLSFIGGLAGYLLGMGLTVSAAPALAKITIPIKWDLTLGLGVLALSVVVGLAASAYPALKAAKMDPAEALRFI